MKNKFTLEIPTPCSENWNQMTVVEQGRFCTACQTPVIDFSGMNETEIKNFFRQHTGKVCGRVQAHQLKAYMLPAKPRFSFTLFSVLGLSAFFAPVVGMSKSKPVHVVQPTVLDSSIIEDEQNQFAPDSGNYIITGNIFGKDNSTQGLPGVTVLVKGTQNGTSSETDGNFSLQVNKINSDSITLVFSFIGYVTFEKEILLPKATNINTGNIYLNIDNILLGEVMMGVIATKWYAPRTIWYQFKQVFQ